MRKIISFFHISLDGFVCGPTGDMSWIKIDDELFAHVEKRISKGNAALYGRKTYEMMEAYWPTAADKPNATRHDKEHSRWYKHAHKIVLSTTLQQSALTNTTVISGHLTEGIHAIKQFRGSNEDILLFGSPSATHALIEQNLIDGYWLFVNPVILGEGIPLFKNGKEKKELKLISTRSFNSGVVELNYVTNEL